MVSALEFVENQGGPGGDHFLVIGRVPCLCASIVLACRARERELTAFQGELMVVLGNMGILFQSLEDPVVFGNDNDGQVREVYWMKEGMVKNGWMRLEWNGESKDR